MSGLSDLKAVVGDVAPAKLGWMFSICEELTLKEVPVRAACCGSGLTVALFEVIRDNLFSCFCLSASIICVKNLND